jgi:thiamine-monophosphate kinase
VSDQASETPLGPGAEFDAIRAMLRRWGDVADGIGDDAAVLDVPPGERLVVSTDASVEDVHFRRSWLSTEEVGYRAATAALSDLAAMAAAPLGILVAIALPDSWRDAMQGVTDGIGAAARAARTRILGGNLSRGRELSITTTVLGSAAKRLPRTGARPGDVIWVTGRLGGPRAALEALLAGRVPEPAHRERFAHPAARIAEARWLAQQGAVAGIDISDGLAADLGHLAAASGVAIDVHLERLPVLEGVTPEQAAASGEEYELAIATPRSLDAAAFARTFGIPLTAIGRVAEGTAGVHLVAAGARVAPAGGHDHLSR